MLFRSAADLKTLNLAKKNNSQVHYAKGTPSHLKGALTACRQTGSGSISLLYSRFFSPFPHGTGSLSVSQEYLALPDGPGGFSQGSTCPDLLRIPIRFIKLYLYETFTLYGVSFQTLLIQLYNLYLGPTTPILP